LPRFNQGKVLRRREIRNLAEKIRKIATTCQIIALGLHDMEPENMPVLLLHRFK